MDRGLVLALISSLVIAVLLVIGVPAAATAGLLSFVWPWALAALVVLPPLYRLLRVLPPAPRRILFPPLRLLFGLMAREETPRKTPWWLIVLRLTALVLAIFGFAQPIFAPGKSLTGQGPLLLVVDDGWASAGDWQTRQQLALDLIDKALQEAKDVYLATTAPVGDANGVPKVTGPLSPGAARERVLALQPKPWAVDREAASAQFEAVSVSQATSIYLSDGLEGVGTQALALQLQQRGNLTIYAPQKDELPVVLLPPENEGAALQVKLRRPATDMTLPVPIAAYAENGRVLAELQVNFPEGVTEATAVLDLPLELRNELGRVEVAVRRTAAGVALVDEGTKRRPVGLITEGSPDSAQPFLDPLYYVDKALQPFVEIRRGNIEALLKRDLAVLVFADKAPAKGAERQMVDRWIETGGIALRFAGSHLAEAEDDFSPVRLRRGERALSGILLWGEPARLAPFEDRSPFAGLAIPDDVTIKRQILAEPSLDLAERSWVQLMDGTPLVTAEKRGNGWLVLVHTGGTPEWSSLPLSGLFVDMLRRIVALSEGVSSASMMKGPLPAIQLLDGFGRLSGTGLGAQPLQADQAQSSLVSFHQPPGYYGKGDMRRALNLGPTVGETKALGDFPSSVQRQSYTPSTIKDLTGYLLAVAFLLLLIEGGASLILRDILRFDGNGRIGSSVKKTTAGILILFGLFLSGGQSKAQAIPSDDFAAKASLDLRLAYVVTGIREVDEASRAGLTGLGYILKQRTSAEPAEPLGVDPVRDDLAFFALLYWPIDARQTEVPPEAIKRLSHFMNSGGTLILDVRDGNPQGAAAARLRDLGRSLQLPVLRPLPKDHVLTKSFYLLSEFPGRWSGGSLWVEATEDRVNDGVSGVIVGYGDYAAAWAADELGRPLYPVVPGGEAQREMAYRVGVNMVMYALTGSYKTDQVHVPAIIERLGE
jgi:hypothetical protein